MGPRKFRTTPYVEQDTSWTDTPADRARKEQERRERKTGSAAQGPSVEELEIAARDARLAAQVDKHTKEVRSKSLMEMHTKKQAKRKAESGPTPFSWDRERDMAVTGVDPKKKRQMLASSQGFASRFAPAAGGRYTGR